MSDLTLDRLKNNIRTLLSLEDPPNYILFHIGGHDLGCKKLGYLHCLLVRFLSWLAKNNAGFHVDMVSNSSPFELALFK